MGIFDDVLHAADGAANAVGRFGHWAWYGDRPGAGLGAVPGQFLHSINPTSRSGFVNLASMLVPGGGHMSEGGLDKGPAEGILQGWHPGADFRRYSMPHAQMSGQVVMREGTPLYGVGRGTPKQIAAYNPGMEEIIRTAQRNPLLRAGKDVVSQQRQNAMEKQSALDMARQQAARSMAARRQIDEHLNSAPMQAHQAAPEHDAALIHGPSVINHPHFLRAMLQRRYQAQLGHNRMN